MAGQRLADVVGVALVEVGDGMRRWTWLATAPIRRDARPARSSSSVTCPLREAGSAIVWLIGEGVYAAARALDGAWPRASTRAKKRRSRPLV